MRRKKKIGRFEADFVCTWTYSLMTWLCQNDRFVFWLKGQVTSKSIDTSVLVYIRNCWNEIDLNDGAFFMWEGRG